MQRIPLLILAAILVTASPASALSTTAKVQCELQGPAYDAIFEFEDDASRWALGEEDSWNCQYVSKASLAFAGLFYALDLQVNVDRPDRQQPCPGSFTWAAAEFPEISGTATNSQTGYTADFSLESHELGFRNGRLFDSNTSCQFSF